MLEMILAIIILVGVGLEAYMVVNWNYNRNSVRDLTFYGICLITLITSISLLVLSLT